jgi:hypothetical protein
MQYSIQDCIFASNAKIVELAKKIEAINPNNKEDAGRSGSNTEVFDI